MSSGPGREVDYAAAARAVGAAEPTRRRRLLAEYVVEFGEPFVSFLAGTAPGLAAGANSVLTSWLGGERVTQRADELERRILELRRQTQEADDPLLARLAADAILRLPAGHELRDEAFAAYVLLNQVQRAAAPDGDVNELLVALFYLLHHNLVPPGQFSGLIDQAITAVGSRNPHPAAVRDLIFAAHAYCIERAAEGLRTRGEEYDLWLGRAQRLLEVAEDASLGLDFGPRLAGMRARQLDVANEARRAADAYAEFLAAGGGIPGSSDAGMSGWAALSEATLRLQTGEPQRVRERLEPLADGLLDQYLTAVTDADIARTGFAHGRAVSLLTSALIHLDEAEAAFRVIDTGKSARLRYRAALRRHPDRRQFLDLERAILAAARSPSGKAGGPAGLPLATRLLEQYRQLRPSLTAPLAQAHPAAAVSQVLAPGEVIVALGALDDMTVLWAVAADGTMRCTALLSYGWGFWDTLLDERADGWRRFLAAQGTAPPGSAGPPEADGRQSLDRLLLTADRVLGTAIADLAGRVDSSVSQLTVIPHRWLHLVPYWALPALAGLQTAVYSSTDELVASRSAPAAGPGHDLLVVANPTGDLSCSAAEALAVSRLAPSAPATVLTGPSATAPAIAAGLRGAQLLHFSGHAYSDHRDPERSALLVAPAGEFAADPFPGWSAAATGWQDGQDGWRTAEVPGVGRLTERTDAATGDTERLLERGAAPTLLGRYADGTLRIIGELWSAADILALGPEAACRLVFLSACASGIAGGESSYVDEYGGLPAALRLAGVSAVICSLWPVDEGFTALYADVFYELLAGETADLAAAVRQARHLLRTAGKADVTRRLDRLADAVRATDPRTAFVLEAYRYKITTQYGEYPYGSPWEWASFYAVGGGMINLTGGTSGPRSA
jgi:CHAT domain